MSLSKNVIKGGAVVSSPLRLKSVAEERELIESRQRQSVPVDELEAIRRQAFEEGRAEGVQAGFQEGYQTGAVQGRAEAEEQVRMASEEILQREEQAVTDFVNALQAFADSAHDAIREWRAAEVEAHALLGIEIARRAVGKELEASKESLIELTKQALAELHQGLEFRILVNPSDTEVLSRRRQEIMEALSHVRGIDVVADTTIESGCMIESHTGTIDARIDAYLARIAGAALKEKAA